MLVLGSVLPLESLYFEDRIGPRNLFFLAGSSSRDLVKGPIFVTFSGLK